MRYPLGNLFTSGLSLPLPLCITLFIVECDKQTRLHYSALYSVTLKEVSHQAFCGHQGPLPSARYRVGYDQYCWGKHPRGAVNEDKLAASGAENLGPEKGLDEEKKRFWELQESISVVSAPTPSFTEACVITQVDENTRPDPTGTVNYQPCKLSVSRTDGSQLDTLINSALGAAFLIERDTKPLPHAILADEPGMGKLLQA